MRLKLFNVAVGISLVLCVATAALWMFPWVTVGAYGNAWAGEPRRGDSPVVAFGHAFGVPLGRRHDALSLALHPTARRPAEHRIDVA